MAFFFTDGYKRFPLIVVLMAICAIVTAQQVQVKDFNAFPDDGLDDARGVQAALQHAKTHHINTVLFEKGRYDLLEVAAPSLNAHIGLTNCNGLRLKGSAAGETWLVKKNPQQNNTILPAHLRFDHCNDLTVEDLVIDNAPQYATAGKVVERTGTGIVVEVEDGLPAVDGMGCYTANIWDGRTRMLKQVPSLTFIEDAAKESLYWTLQTRAGKRYMHLNSRRFAEAVATGDIISWHFGAGTMFQLALNYCNNLTLKNILTVNIAGWGIQTYACKNIQAQKIIFKANGRQLAVGPRDAWKINSCNGTVDIDSMYVEGVRWDGQNVHSAFFQVKEVLAFNKIRVWKKYTSVAPFIPDSIGCWNGDHVTKLFAVKWQKEQATDGGVYGVIETGDSLPAFVKNGTLITADAWDIDHYKLSNSAFKNIAGCAGVIKCSKATLQRVSYDHIMYPAIVLGTEILTHNEATFPQDVLIRECSFNASGWVPRIRTKGLVGIANNGTTANAIGAIHFDNCSFSRAPVGIDASGLQLLKITNSRFTGVAQPYKTTSRVIFENNKVDP